VVMLSIHREAIDFPAAKKPSKDRPQTAQWSRFDSLNQLTR
jgi:hypothetical protein